MENTTGGPLSPDALGEAFSLALRGAGDVRAGYANGIDVNAFDQTTLRIQLEQAVGGLVVEREVGPPHNARVFRGEPGVAVGMKVLDQQVAVKVVIEQRHLERARIGVRKTGPRFPETPA